MRPNDNLHQPFSFDDVVTAIADATLSVFPPAVQRHVTPPSILGMIPPPSHASLAKAKAKKPMGTFIGL